MSEWRDYINARIYALGGRSWLSYQIAMTGAIISTGLADLGLRRTADRAVDAAGTLLAWSIRRDRRRQR